MNAYRWSDLRLGLSADFQITITQPMLDAFRDLSGDVNPLHLDAHFAAERGHPGVVVFGMLVASFYSTLAGVYLPGKFCLLHEVNVSFHKPVYMGDALEVSGEISHLNEAYRQAEIKAHIKRAATLMSRARIRVGVDE